MIAGSAVCRLNLSQTSPENCVLLAPLYHVTMFLLSPVIEQQSFGVLFRMRRIRRAAV